MHVHPHAYRVHPHEAQVHPHELGGAPAARRGWYVFLGYCEPRTGQEATLFEVGEALHSW